MLFKLLHFFRKRSSENRNINIFSKIYCDIYTQIKSHEAKSGLNAGSGTQSVYKCRNYIEQLVLLAVLQILISNDNLQISKDLLVNPSVVINASLNVLYLLNNPLIPETGTMWVNFHHIKKSRKKLCCLSLKLYSRSHDIYNFK